MWFGSSSSRAKSSFDTLWKWTPVTRFRIGSRFFTSPPFSFPYRSSTVAFVGANTRSSRRRTVNGKITFPKSYCLKSPRSRSAMLQMKLEALEKDWN